MANFLVQTIDGQVKTDFGFGLIEAVEAQNWRNAGRHDVVLSDSITKSDFSSFIPIGTIDFTKRFLACYHDIHTIYPINIPNELQTPNFLKRTLITQKWDDIDLQRQMFVKSHETLKGFTDIISDKDKLPHKGLYQISDVVDIDSEWRAFVFDKELVGLQYYSGDFTLFPDVKLIKDMISSYNDSPPAYTLDIGVHNDIGSFIIEVHNFYSCGLYGFSDWKILPQMFLRSFYHLVKNKR